jgi:hypothetical protein
MYDCSNVGEIQSHGTVDFRIYDTASSDDDISSASDPLSPSVIHPGGIVYYDPDFMSIL